MHITKQLDCTPIHQTFFVKSFIKSNIIAAKHSRYTVQWIQYMRVASQCNALIIIMFFIGQQFALDVSYCTTRPLQHSIVELRMWHTGYYS